MGKMRKLTAPRYLLLHILMVYFFTINCWAEEDSGEGRTPATATKRGLNDTKRQLKDIHRDMRFIKRFIKENAPRNNVSNESKPAEKSVESKANVSRPI